MHRSLSVFRGRPAPNTAKSHQWCATLRARARPAGRLVAAVAFCVALIPQYASAQGKLSQLDFDTDAKSPPPPEVKAEPSEAEIRALLEGADAPPAAKAPPQPGSPAGPQRDPEAPPAGALVPQPTAAPLVVPSDGPTAAPSKAGGTSVPLVVTRYEWERLPDAEPHYLVPRLRGPSADKKAPSYITTQMMWTRGKKGCGEVEEPEQLCRKAKALKELFERFSGNNDFYNSHCVAPCDDERTTAVLTGFVVVDTRRGDFKVLEKGSTCQYQLQASQPENKWVALEGKRGVCTCLPTTCGVRAD